MRFETVVAAITVNDDLAQAVIQTAKDFTKSGGALHIVSAWPTLATASAAPLAVDMGAVQAPLSQEAIAARRATRDAEEATLRKLAADIAPEAVITFHDGEPADIVAETARMVGADIIVTGSHQKGFWNALLTGGRSREVVREAPCGVFLVTKPFAEKLPAKP